MYSRDKTSVKHCKRTKMPPIRPTKLRMILPKSDSQNGNSISKHELKSSPKIINIIQGNISYSIISSSNQETGNRNDSQNCVIDGPKIIDKSAPVIVKTLAQPKTFSFDRHSRENQTNPVYEYNLNAGGNITVEKVNSMVTNNSKSLLVMPKENTTNSNNLKQRPILPKPALQLKKLRNSFTVFITNEKGGTCSANILWKIKNGINFYLCPLCIMESKNLTDIIKHIAEHNKSKSFQCGFCHLSFTRESTLSMHHKLHLDSLLIIPSDNQNENNIRSAKCVRCKGDLSLDEDITNHVCKKSSPHSIGPMTNRQNTEGAGNMATKCFVKEAPLRLPPYICCSCKVNYCSYKELRNHACWRTRSNQSRARYNCYFCDEGFVLKSGIVEHLKVIHNLNLLNKKEFRCIPKKRNYRLHKKRARDKEDSLPDTSPLSEGQWKRNVLNELLSTETENLMECEGSPKSQYNEDSLQSLENIVNFDPSIHDPSLSNFNFTNGFLDINNVQTTCDKNTNSDTPATDEHITVEELDISCDNSIGDDLESIIHLHICDLCSGYFLSEKSLSDHKIKCSGKKMIVEASSHLLEDIGVGEIAMYTCNTCYIRFKDMDTFLKHTESHTEPSFTCIYCSNKPFAAQADLLAHLLEHAVKGEFPCSHCGELHDSEEFLKYHLSTVHLGLKPDRNTRNFHRKNLIVLTDEYKNSVANQKLDSVSLTLSEKVLQQLVKPRASSSKRSAKNSGNSDTVSKRKNNYQDKASKTKKAIMYKCEHCGKEFKRGFDCKRHIRKHTNEKPFTCAYCTSSFSLKSSLVTHMKTHLSVNDVACHICGNFFWNTGALRVHMRLHTGEKPHKCQYCPLAFRTSAHCKSHEKRHEKNNHFAPFVKSGEKTHDCTKCGLQFSTNSKLKLHNIRRHETQAAFTCHICDKKFLRKNSLDAHLFSCAKVCPWRCNYCSKWFARKFNLKQHIERWHSPLQQPNSDFATHSHWTKTGTEGNQEIVSGDIGFERVANEANDILASSMQQANIFGPTSTGMPPDFIKAINKLLLPSKDQLFVTELDVELI